MIETTKFQTIQTLTIMSKSILITGATGKQGSAFINAILSSPSASQFTLVALTRNAASASAQKLVSKGVKVIQGELNDIPAVFEKAKAAAGGPIWGAFIVLVSCLLVMIRISANSS
jgi:nucleoside-diphosphate-sugar epimerase